jgi:hypothetical protein
MGYWDDRTDRQEVVTEKLRWATLRLPWIKRSKRVTIIPSLLTGMSDTIYLVLILLEGPDGGGKTTLCNALRDQWLGIARPLDAVPLLHGVTTLHFGVPDPPDRDPFEEYALTLDAEPLRSQCLDTNHLVILDRFHIGDVVYGPIYRKKSRLSPAGVLHLEMQLQSLNALRVMCLPPLSVIQQRIVERGDWYIDPLHLPLIYDGYRQHATQYEYYKPVWDDDPATIAQTILTLMVLEHTMAKNSLLSQAQRLSDATAGTWTGTVMPSLVLVGDQHGNGSRARHEFRRPFTPWQPGASAEYLLAALLKTGLHRDVGMVNAHHSGVNLRAVRASTHPDAAWLALGANASRTLDNLSIAHTRIPHPQWQNRFAHAAQDAYAAAIRDAMPFPGLVSRESFLELERNSE